MIIIALVGGVLGLVVSLALRRNTGKARSMRHPGAFLDDRFVFLSLPSFSLVLLGLGTLGLGVPLIGGDPFLTPFGVMIGLLGAVMVTVGAVGSLWGLFGKVTPRFALPKWLREEH